MALPRLIVTGASGFIGRHLLDRLKERYRIVGIARRSQVRCGAPVHPNIDWHQVDIGDRQALFEVFDRVDPDASGPGGDFVIHLAAHYDFTGEKHPEYERTNVVGLRNVLDACVRRKVRRFIFSSSVAACRFPAAGTSLTEKSPADGEHIYAVTKRIGEEMLSEYRDHFPSAIVRFAALFSDWCEYPPLFIFLQTWLSRAWNRSVLGGRGESAIPYLHVRDAARFCDVMIRQADRLEPGEIVLCSGDETVNHTQLFEAATHYYEGRTRRALRVPRLLCRPGMYVQMLVGFLLGELPFERPWMANYIDLELRVDARHSRQRLDWEPRERLDLLRRLPFLLENLKADPAEWNRRNRAAMKSVRIRPNLKIHWLLEKHQAQIDAAFRAALTEEPGRRRFPTYQSLSPQQLQWNLKVVLRQLMAAVRTRERAIYLTYCRDLAEQRYAGGFNSDEVCEALQELNRICISTLTADSDSADVREHLYDHITMTMRFGCDQVQETFELLAESEEADGGQAPVDSAG